MAIPKVIGKKAKEAVGGRYSGVAFQRAAATNNFTDNFYDLGFRPEQIYIENVSGDGILEVTFAHSIQYPINDNGKFNVDGPTDVTVYSEIDPMTSRIFRMRDHQLIALKVSSGSSTFRIEAW